jgi:hypothetical protein
MPTALPSDVYVSVQAEADTVCTWYMSLEGRDVLAYVTTEGYLRVKEIQSLVAYTLEDSVLWCSVLNVDVDGLGSRLFFLKKDGTFWLMRCKRIIDFGLPRIQLSDVHLPVDTHNFSVSYRFRDSKWIMVTDDAAKHDLFIAEDDSFSIAATNRTIFHSLSEDNITVRRPTLGIHQTAPGDVVTISVDYLNSQTKFKGVATYVIDLFKAEGEV